LLNKPIVISLYGQSASGKTTLLNNLNGQNIGGMVVKTIPNGIRGVYAIESTKIMTPDDVIAEYGAYASSFEKWDVYIVELLNRYFLSQKWLQSRYHYIANQKVQEDYSCIYVTDRSPLDFYSYTVGALNYFNKSMNIRGTSIDALKILDVHDMKERTMHYMHQLLSGLVIVRPHGKDIAEEITGARRSGLQEEFTGENWYKHSRNLSLAHVDITEVDVHERTEKMKSFIEEVVKNART
jgi:hypothetical protein